MARNKSEQPRRGRTPIAELPGWTVELRANDHWVVHDETGRFKLSRISFTRAIHDAKKHYDILHTRAYYEDSLQGSPIHSHPDAWRWSAQEDNDIDSMSDDMVISITAKQLRKVIEDAAIPHRAMRPGRQPGTMSVDLERLWTEHLATLRTSPFRNFDIKDEHGTKQK